MIIRSNAPLRLGFAGGGTDIDTYSKQFGGVAINATINWYAHCTLIPLDNGKVIFNATDIQQHYEGEATSQIPLDQECYLHRGVYNRIVKDYNNNQPLSVKLITRADAPIGSGLGTSSTMVVAIIGAFVEYLHLPLGNYDIAKLAYSIEREDLGLKGGKQDQYAAAFGGFNFLEFHQDGDVTVNPLKIKNNFKLELQESTILCFSGNSRNSSEIIEKQSSSIKDNKTSLEALHNLKSSVSRMKAALLSGNIEKFSEEINYGWNKKRISCPAISTSTIEDLLNAGLKAGAKAGRVSGAGGGGFLMFVVTQANKEDVIRILQKMGGTIGKFSFTEIGCHTWTVE